MRKRVWNLRDVKRIPHSDVHGIIFVVARRVRRGGRILARRGHQPPVACRVDVHLHERVVGAPERLVDHAPDLGGEAGEDGRLELLVWFSVIGGVVVLLVLLLLRLRLRLRLRWMRRQFFFLARVADIVRIIVHA